MMSTLKTFDDLANLLEFSKQNKCTAEMSEMKTKILKRAKDLFSSCNFALEGDGK